MANMVNIFLFGKKYTVPDNLTIMNAMEYAGYQLVRGCGCRNGFCGACATIYRIKGDKELTGADIDKLLYGEFKMTGLVLKDEKILYALYNMNGDFFKYGVSIVNSNYKSTSDILKINKNSKDEIISVDYNLEKTYKILTNVSEILKSISVLH